jgi:hypothetical protein
LIDAWVNGRRTEVGEVGKYGDNGKPVVVTMRPVDSSVKKTTGLLRPATSPRIRFWPTLPLWIMAP